MCNSSAVRVRVGDHLVYTTPTKGTFYYALRYEGRYLVFIIIARMAWLVGFYGANGMYQMQYKDIKGLYMRSDICEMMPFEGRHAQISSGGTGRTMLGQHAFRHAFDAIDAYKGPGHPEPAGFRASLGLVVIYLLESKFRIVFERVCSGEGRLGTGWIESVITEWSSLSKEGMKGINDPKYSPGNCGIEEIQGLDGILDNLFFLHIDGNHQGIFKHDRLPSPPREMAWDHIDPGEGDGDIPLPAEKVDKAVGHKRKGRLRIEVLGGGAGGIPHVPPWFLDWEQRDNKQQCDLVVRKLREELGLEVVDAPARAPAPAPPLNNDAPRTAPTVDGEHVLSHGGVVLFRSDIATLRSHQFLTDGVISFLFANLSSKFAADDGHILLLPPSIPFMLSKLVDPAEIAAEAEQLRLASRRLVLLPVNDNPDAAVADGGSHWSLLVLDNFTRYGPRFVHHDSLGGANLPAARRLADTLRPLLSAATTGIPLVVGRTPMQTNGYDCGVHVIAVAKAICGWWKRLAHIQDEEDWLQAVWREADAESVIAMREELLDGIRRQLNKGKSRPSPSDGSM